jgi:hypothetical protein
MPRLAVATACLIACALFLLLRESASAQTGSGSSRASPQRATRPMTPDEFYQSFWKHLNRQESPYKKWEPLAGKTGLREGEGPHGDFVQTFANKIALDSPTALPYGAVLVAENYDADKKLKDITVMYRSKAADPQHNDWYWLKYLPDGSIARTPEKEGKKPIAGKVSSCIECHARAGGKDFVYANDSD